MDLHAQPPPPQLDAQALINALIAQRNEAQNHCAQLQALLAQRDARIAQLEAEQRAAKAPAP